MTALERLKARLREASHQTLKRPWRADTSIDEVVAKLKVMVENDPGTYVPKNLQEAAVRHFWTTRRIENFREALLVSHGLTLPVVPGQRGVIEDKERFPILLNAVDTHAQGPQRFRRCFQGLLKGYLSYDPESSNASPVGAENWQTLRTYLRKRTGQLLSARHSPQWTQTIQAHPALFSANPCQPYGVRLLAGDSSQVNELRATLEISADSWFIQKLYLAQVEAGVSKNDEGFLQVLPRLVELLHEHEPTRNEGLILVLNRAVRVPTVPQPENLRDAAVSWWGSPWLKSRAMWAHPALDPQARKMVSSWQKLAFITAFFTLLAEERSADTRRLAFWARYVDVITDIHFALGYDARTNPSPDFRKLRKDMEGCVVDLMDNNSVNNAFIMTMGDVVVVEFSLMNNACYGYDARKELPFDLSQPLGTTGDGRNSLKSRSKAALYLRHADLTSGKWERQFEAKLREKFGVVPEPSGRAPATRRGADRRGDAPKAAPWNTPPVSINTFRFVPNAPRPSQAQVPAQAPTPAPSVPPFPEPVAAPPATRDPVKKVPLPNRRARSLASPPPPASSPWSTPPEYVGKDWTDEEYSPSALRRFAGDYGLLVDDLGPRNGNLWVRTDDRDREVNRVLKNWGFTYKNASKGWWRDI